MKQPWLTPEGKKIWKTEAQYWAWLHVIGDQSGNS